VMNQGRIVQLGAAREVYERPRTRFVTDFLGEANIFSGQVVGSDAGGVALALNPTDQVLAPPQPGLAVGQTVDWAVRPEHVRISAGPPPAPFHLPATVQHVSYQGASEQYRLALRNGAHFLVFAQSGLLPVTPQVGQRVFLTWEPIYTLILSDSLV
jgi:ABC-type Fe3+/spermidine/putrescine transport system ATPase subunit